MTPENFVYWLQGVLEIADPKQLDEIQIKIIKDHIALVLKKQTPTYTTITPPITTFGPTICNHPNMCFCSKCSPITLNPVVTC